MTSLTWRARAGLLLWAALLAGGCGQKPPAPAPPVAAHAAATAAPDEAPAEPSEPPPSHDPFEQPDDVPLDSKALLQEMRHDCCTELPAAEIEKHSSPSQ